MSFRRSHRRRRNDICRRVRRAVRGCVAAELRGNGRTVGAPRFNGRLFSQSFWSHPALVAARKAVGRALAALILFGVYTDPAWAQVDPLAASTFVHSYATRESVWLTTGRTDLFGARLHAQLGVGRLGVAVRAAASGLPGTFDGKDTRTYHSVEGYVAAHFNVASAGTALVAAAVLAGRSLSFDTTATVTKPGSLTIAGGMAISAPKTYAVLAVGAHQNLRGLAVLGTVQLPLAGNVGLICDFAAASRGQAFLRAGFAVTLE